MTPPRVIAITDRRLAGGVEALLGRVRGLAALSIPAIMLREKDLSDADLLSLARQIMGLLAGTNTRLLINGPPHIAEAAGAHGVHFPSATHPPARTGALLRGASIHTEHELRTAESQDVDYALLGPVFAPLSKAGHHAPLGAAGVARFATASRLPIIALGGVTPANAASLLQAGAHGVAGIGSLMDPANDASWSVLLAGLEISPCR